MLSEEDNIVTRVIMFDESGKSGNGAPAKPVREICKEYASMEVWKKNCLAEGPHHREEHSHTN